MYRRLIGSVFALLFASSAHAQSAGAAAKDEGFPSRPINVTVPYAPGATTDQIARGVANLMARDLGQPVIVENRAGANGIIAATRVARAAPDGYSLLLSSDSTGVLNPLLYRNPGYDIRDLKPVALLTDLPVVMMVSTKLPVRNLSEFVSYAKAHPGEINYSSTGIGGTFHLSGELFSQEAGIKLTHVPYKGGAPAMQALVAGDVQALFGVVGSALPQIKAARVRPIAVATRERLAVLPNVPTFAELGFPEFVVLIRYGLMVPSATPADRVERLTSSVNKALGDASFRKTFTELGFLLPEQSNPQAYAELIEHDRALWVELIKRRNLSLD